MCVRTLKISVTQPHRWPLARLANPPTGVLLPGPQPGPDSMYLYYGLGLGSHVVVSSCWDTGTVLNLCPH